MHATNLNRAQIVATNLGTGKEIVATNLGTGKEIVATNLGTGKEIVAKNLGTGKEIVATNLGTGKELRELILCPNPRPLVFSASPNPNLAPYQKVAVDQVIQL